MRKDLLIIATLLLCGGSVFADVQLPPPAKTGGTPLMETLAKRATDRSFKPEPELNAQTVSDLLFAVCGINRDNGKRTIPTALNVQDIQVYLLTKNGASLYLPDKNLLKDVQKTDLRAAATKRPGMGQQGAAVFVIVSDLTKYQGKPDDCKKYRFVHAGAAIQNLYLVCASKGLRAVVCGSFDNEALRKGLKLAETQDVLLAVIVGN